MLKTGKHSIEADAWTKYLIQVAEPTLVQIVDKDTGEAVDKLISTKAEIKVDKQKLEMEVKAKPNQHWTIDALSRREKTDPVPMEIPEDKKNPPDLFSQLREFLRNEVAHQYGKNSQELETFDEADDFLIEEEDFTSGYTVNEMEEDIPIPTETPPEPPQAESPPEADPTPPTEPETAP